MSEVRFRDVTLKHPLEIDSEDPEIWKGMHALGIDLVEGYGMTECAPMITFSRPDDLIPGCAGKALPTCQVCIKEGEICAKGDNVMQGYYGMEKERFVATLH